MSEREQIAAFTEDVERVIDRYRSEFDLSLASAMGALQIIGFELWKEHSNAVDEEED